MRQLAVNLPYLCSQFRRFLRLGFGPRLGPLLVLVVETQPQDLAQDAFALAGGLGGELVGAALHQKGGVDEGLVVHVQQINDLGLRLAHGGLAEGEVAVIGPALQLQQ